MTYRIAVEGDLRRIITIKNEAKTRVINEGLKIWQGDYPMDDMLAGDLSKGWGRVVEEDGIILAYAALHPSEEEYPADTFLRRHLLSFGRVMVCDAALGHHMASHLVGEMVQEARRDGYAGVGIGVDACNERALNLYRRHGFVREGAWQYIYAYLDTYVLYF